MGIIRFLLLVLAIVMTIGQGKEVDEIEREILEIMHDMEKSKASPNQESGTAVESDKPQDAVLSIDRKADEQKPASKSKSNNNAGFRTLSSGGAENSGARLYSEDLLNEAFEDAKKIVYKDLLQSKNSWRINPPNVSQREQPAFRLAVFNKPNIEDYQQMSNMSLTNLVLQEGVRLANWRAAKQAKKKKATMRQFRFEDVNKNTNILSSKISTDCKRQYSVSQRCQERARYRSVEGVCNDINVPVMGRAKTPYSRILKPDYGDGVMSIRLSKSGRDLPNARRVTKTLLTTRGHQDEDGVHPSLSQLFQAMGQFTTHMNMKTPPSDPRFECCENRQDESHERLLKCAEIVIDNKEDNLFPCFNLRRSLMMSPLDCNPTIGSRQGTSFSHFQDLTAVYGPKQDIYDNLKGSSGKINRPRGNATVTGDAGRANENPYLFALHEIFARFHNHVVGKLHSVNKRQRLTDDQLFEEARKINIGVFQHILYKEYLPYLLGRRFYDENAPQLRLVDQGYNPFTLEIRKEYTPEITSAFDGAAYRFGHSIVIDRFELRDPRTGQLIESSTMAKIQDAGLTQFIAKMGDSGTKFAEVVAGMLRQPMGKVDLKVSEFMHEKLFGGQDLLAVNIMRGRDHGLPGYIEFLNGCNAHTGRQIRTWKDLSQFIPEEDIQKMKDLYEDARDLDLYMGILAERKDEDDAVLGPVGRCIVADNFFKNMVGDHHFFDNAGHKGYDPFTIDQLNSIRRITLADVLCLTVRSGDSSRSLHKVPERAFERPKTDNPEKNCQEVQGFDAVPWRQFKPPA